MPVTLTVSQVRQELYRAERGETVPRDGAASTALLGQWFHQAVPFLVGSNAESGHGPLAMLGELDADLDVWKSALIAEIYDRFVGPRLTHQQAALQESAQQVLAFWEATQAVCHWFAELTWRLSQERPSRRRMPTAPWQMLSTWVTTEEPLSFELREPGWTDSVRLIGVADAIIRLAETNAWCAIELKTGKTSPAADLGQACLYHLLLSSMNSGADTRGAETGTVDSAGTLALVSFRPQREERLFDADELIVAKKYLLRIIGRLAGVVDQPVDPDAPQPATTEPHDPPDDELQPATPSPEHEQLGQAIISTYAEYGVQVVLDDPITVGPTFLRFPIALGRGTRVAKVERHAAELQVRLGLPEEPFISRDQGRLVIDVRRADRQIVHFADVRKQLPAPDEKLGGSHVPIGVDLSGRLQCINLAQPEHAHLLVAGTTGSGKSEWLRMALAGLIVTNTPQTLRLVLIDPKRNAFHVLANSPYLWQPLVFPDEQPASGVLELLVAEMDRRYAMLDGADTIVDLAQRTASVMPRIVCVCDEYRDLISQSRDERKLIEAHICRLGAKARAAGIHLILATQEPSRETITGPLDANMPARVGLKMGRAIESNMLLGQPGAEKLLGHGDLLFKDIGSPRRLQSPLLSAASRSDILENAAVEI